MAALSRRRTNRATSTPAGHCRVSISTSSTPFCSISRTVAEPRRTASVASFFPNVVEAGSGLVFAEFFQNERDTSRKGVVVIDLTEGEW